MQNRPKSKTIKTRVLGPPTKMSHMHTIKPAYFKICFRTHLILKLLDRP